MSNYKELLQQQLADYQVKCGDNREKLPILEILWDCYYQSNPIRTEQIKQVEDKLAPAFEALSFEDSNDAFCLLYGLVEAYQHAAFIEGIQVGLQIDGLLHKKCTP